MRDNTDDWGQAVLKWDVAQQNIEIRHIEIKKSSEEKVALQTQVVVPAGVKLFNIASDKLIKKSPFQCTLCMLVDEMENLTLDQEVSCHLNFSIALINIIQG